MENSDNNKTVDEVIATWREYLANKGFKQGKVFIKIRKRTLWKGLEEDRPLKYKDRLVQSVKCWYGWEATGHANGDMEYNLDVVLVKGTWRNKQEGQEYV